MTATARASASPDLNLVACFFDHATDAKRHGEDDPGDRLYREYLLIAALSRLSTAGATDFSAAPDVVERAATYLEKCWEISATMRRQLPVVLRRALSGDLPLSVVQEIIKVAITRISNDLTGRVLVSAVADELSSVTLAIDGLAEAIQKTEH